MATVLEVLSQHRIVSQGLSKGTPDTCSCGARTLPAPGEDVIEVRRHEAFLAHLDAELSAAVNQAQADLLNNLAQYAVDYVGVDGEQLFDLVDQQVFDDTASWLRHRATLIGQETRNG